MTWWNEPATAENAQRGWRQFLPRRSGFLPVTVEIAGQNDRRDPTDTNGYVSLSWENHGLAPAGMRPALR
ncbi:MAG: hypothetical protein U0P48_11435 [Ancrocorticia sp.]